MAEFRSKARGSLKEFWHSGLPLLICWLSLHVLTGTGADGKLGGGAKSKHGWDCTDQ